MASAPPPSTPLTCPTCPGGQALAPAPGSFGEHACPACGGAYLPYQAALDFFTTRAKIPVEELSAAAQSPGPEPQACRGCHQASPQVNLRGTAVNLCNTCGGAWLPGGAQTRLLPATGNVRSFVRAAPVESPPTVRSALDSRSRMQTLFTPTTPVPVSRPLGPQLGMRPPVLAAGVLGLALGMGALGFFGVRLAGAGRKPVAVAPKDPDAWLNLSGNQYDVYEFGGRDLPWWRQQLSGWRKDATPDAQARYALGVKRARALKLDVREGPNGTVQVQVTKELALAVHKRLSAP